MSPPLTRDEVVQNLLAFAKETAAAEIALVEAAKLVQTTRRSVQRAKEVLADREAALLLGQVDGITIDGKNAETRQAQLRQHTQSERELLTRMEKALDEAELQQAEASARRAAAKVQFEAWREIAGLLSREE